MAAPMRHEDAERLGIDGQNAYLDELLNERWWQDQVQEFRVLARRVPAEWARNTPFPQ
jgi:hypothetical protein